MVRRVLQPKIETGRVDFYTEKYKDKVIEKGYDIIWQKMILCPCRKDFSSQPVSNCKNCNGLGYYWFEDVKTIALISSAAVQKKFLQWSEDLSGTAYMTINPEYRVAWMDKIIVTSAETVYSEICNVQLDDSSNPFVRLRYPLIENMKMFLFVNAESDLVEISLNDATYFENNTVIKFPQTLSLNKDDNISILYKHNPTYLVIDTMNDYRNTYVKKRRPEETLSRMPIRFLIKKAHLVV